MSALKELRQSKKLSLAAAAELIGTSDAQLHRLENGVRRMTMGWAKRIAQGYGVNISEVLGLDSFTSQVPVVAYVGAGTEVFKFGETEAVDYVDAPPGTQEDTIEAAIVRGDSMYPAYRDRDILYYKRHFGEIDDLVGKECVIRLTDNRQYIKTVMKGTKKGLYTLISYNAVPVLDVKISWAAPVKWVHRADC